MPGVRTRSELAASVLFLHAGALGDLVLTLQVVAAYRRRFPDERVVVAARSPLATWAAAHGAFDAALSLDSLPMHALYFDAPAPDELSALFDRFERVVSFLGHADDPHSRRLQRLTRACLCVDPAPTADTLRDGRHITQQWLDTLAQAGLRLELTDSLGLRPTPGELDLARADLRRLWNSPLNRGVIIHPGSGGRQKCCPLDLLEQAAAQFRHAQRPVAWLIGPVELERGGRSLRERLERTAPVLCSDDLGQVASWVAAIGVYVGNDAGVTHLAATLGTPTVALFGPTDPRVWRPLGPRVRVVRFDTSADEVLTQIERGYSEWIDRSDSDLS